MRNTLFAAALAASLLASTAGPSGLLGQLQSFLYKLWSGPVAENGCGFDPSGGCATIDNGCGWDPDGRCATVDNGCGWDPNGCPGGK